MLDCLIIFQILPSLCSFFSIPCFQNLIISVYLNSVSTPFLCHLPSDSNLLRVIHFRCIFQFQNFHLLLKYNFIFSAMITHLFIYFSIFSFKFLNLSLVTTLSALSVVSNIWITLVFVLLNAFPFDYMLHFLVSLLINFYCMLDIIYYLLQEIFIMSSSLKGVEFFFSGRRLGQSWSIVGTYFVSFPSPKITVLSSCSSLPENSCVIYFVPLYRFQLSVGKIHTSYPVMIPYIFRLLLK